VKDPGFWAKPCYKFPNQISVDIVETDLSVTHAFDDLIVGATGTVKFVAENILPQLGLQRHCLESDLRRRGKPLADVLRALADLLGPDDVLVSHNLAYDFGRVLGVNFWNVKAFPHFCGTEDLLERLLAAPRFCTMIWKTRGPCVGLERLTEEYGVTNEHAHDARGDSKALAECLVKAIRQDEHLPIYTAPLRLRDFNKGAGVKWGAHANWVNLPPKPKMTLHLNGVMDIRVSLKRGAVEMTTDASPGRDVRQKTEESGDEAETP
jgi:hypothetical protein